MRSAVLVVAFVALRAVSAPAQGVGEIPAPDSAAVWAQEIAACLGRPVLPVRWFAAPLPSPLLGNTDVDAGTITLEQALARAVYAPIYRQIVRHELAHLIGGKDAYHPNRGGRFDMSEPRRTFNRRCDTYAP